MKKCERLFHKVRCLVLHNDEMCDYGEMVCPECGEKRYGEGGKMKPTEEIREDYLKQRVSKQKIYSISDVAEIKKKLLEEVFERLKLDLNNHGYRILSVPLKDWDKLKQSLLDTKSEVEKWK